MLLHGVKSDLGIRHYYGNTQIKDGRVQIIDLLSFFKRKSKQDLENTILDRVAEWHNRPADDHTPIWEWVNMTEKEWEDWVIDNRLPKNYE